MRFNPQGCFVEDFKDQCRLVAKGNRNGRMFTLDVSMPQVKAAMFTHGIGVIADIDIWHKRIGGHVNVQWLKSMQTKNIVDGLSKFKVDGMHKVCEAFQLGKQSKHDFLHDKHVSTRPLDVNILMYGDRPRLKLFQVAGFM